jgi:hypothetical protein
MSLFVWWFMACGLLVYSQNAKKWSIVTNYMLDLGNMVVNKVIMCKLSWIYDRSCVLQMGVWYHSLKIGGGLL